MNELNNVKIVLVETSHPGNIGATARAMHNMGLRNLCLVNPKSFPSEVATARAKSGSEVLESVEIVTSIDAALADCQKVFATSSRAPSLSWPTISVRDCATQVVNFTGKIAVVFGPENFGLSNKQLHQCQNLVQIPTKDNGSLNLAQAVQIFSYEAYIAASGGLVLQSDTEPMASYSVMEGFYQHLTKLMIKLNIINTKQPRSIQARIRRMFNRAQLSNNEVNILRGFLSAVDKIT